jgi:hypothetical protein
MDVGYARWAAAVADGEAVFCSRAIFLSFFPPPYLFRTTAGHFSIFFSKATIFLVAIVMLAVVKNGMSWIWGLVGLFLFVFLLMSAIRLYKIIRKKKS